MVKKYSVCYVEIQIMIRGQIMKKLFPVLFSSIFLLMACDVKDDLNKPRTTARTMIIGGVPVHDQDYQVAELRVRENLPVGETP